MKRPILAARASLLIRFTAANELALYDLVDGGDVRVAEAVEEVVRVLAFPESPDLRFLTVPGQKFSISYI